MLHSTTTDGPVILEKIQAENVISLSNVSSVLSNKQKGQIASFNILLFCIIYYSPGFRLTIISSISSSVNYISDVMSSG